jgi:hypothetical protein
MRPLKGDAGSPAPGVGLAGQVLRHGVPGRPGPSRDSDAAAPAPGRKVAGVLQLPPPPVSPPFPPRTAGTGRGSSAVQTQQDSGDLLRSQVAALAQSAHCPPAL